MSFEVAPTLDMSSPDAKRASYDLLVAQVRAVLEGERDWLANLAQFAALVHQSVPHLNWAGFYMARGQELVVGPFQGKVACVRIPFTRGVCGACARSREIQLVEDVHAFPGHIACESASRSELVMVNAPHGDYVFYVATKNNKDQRWKPDNEAWVFARKVSALLWHYYEPKSRWKPAEGSQKFWDWGS